MAKGKSKDLLDTNSLRNFDEYEGALNSITNTIGKQSDIYGLINKKLQATKMLVGSIADKIDNATDLEDKHKKSIYAAAAAYKKSKQVIAESNLQLKKGNITQSEYNKAVKDIYKNYKSVVSEIDTSNKSAKKTVTTLNKMGTEMKSFSEAAEQSQKRLDGIESVIDQIGSSGVDGVKELGDVLKTAASGGKGLSLALGALAGVAAGMAYNFGLIGNKLATIAGYDSKIAGLTGEIDAINQQVKMGVDLPTYDKAGKTITGTFKSVNYVAKQAMLDFNSSVQQMGAAFNAASKTALFGNKLGGVGYGAAQLQLAGVSADEISTSLSAASNVMGKRLSSQLAADMAVMSKRTGQSAENLASVTEYFMRTDKVGAKSAINMQEGLRAMADSAKVDLGGVMEEVAQASKEALGYQIKSGPALAKQVIYAKSLGVSFNDIAKAGKSMVLNYKDSIKNEMQLSAMLGRNVNLSEARSLFAQGKNDEALKSIQAQGLDPAKMNIFQQEALQQALGGLDLNSIQKIAQNQARSGGSLTEGNVSTSNKEYLSRVKERETSLAGANAMISAATELQRIGLNTKEELQKQETIINNVGGIAKLMNERDQQGFLKNAETMLTTALISTVATVVTTFLMSKGGDLFSKFKGRMAATEVGAGIFGKTAGIFGKTMKLGGKLLGKIAYPLAIGMSLYDGFKGFTANANASTGQKFKNAGSSVLNGLTFGLLGEDADTITANATNSRAKKAGAKPGSTVKKPGVVSGKTVTPAAGGVGATPQSLVLSDVQYQTRLQQKMVELLGTSATLLQYILLEDQTKQYKAGEINTMRLSNQLMINARKQMAVGRKEVVGANTGM